MKNIKIVNAAKDLSSIVKMNLVYIFRAVIVMLKMRKMKMKWNFEWIIIKANKIKKLIIIIII